MKQRSKIRPCTEVLIVREMIKFMNIREFHIETFDGSYKFNLKMNICSNSTAIFLVQNYHSVWTSIIHKTFLKLSKKKLCAIRISVFLYR